MDRLISEQAVLEAFREYQGSISDFYKTVKAIPSVDIDTLIDGADAVGYRRGYKEAQKAISSTYKGMTNGEVIKATFPQLMIFEENANKVVWGRSESETKWWNSPYEP